MCPPLSVRPQPTLRRREGRCPMARPELRWRQSRRTSVARSSRRPGSGGRRRMIQVSGDGPTALAEFRACQPVLVRRIRLLDSPAAMSPAATDPKRSSDDRLSSRPATRSRSSISSRACWCASADAAGLPRRGALLSSSYFMSNALPVGLLPNGHDMACFGSAKDVTLGKGEVRYGCAAVAIGESLDDAKEARGPVRRCMACASRS
jgi:hypothetical protein